MSAFSRMTAWLDGDWRKRNYNATFAFTQRLLALVPIFLALLIVDLLGIERTQVTGIVILGIGAFLTIAFSGLGLYRWFYGYGKTGQMKSKFDQPSAKENGHG